jgi:hypothetical protein
MASVRVAHQDHFWMPQVGCSTRQNNYRSGTRALCNFAHLPIGNHLNSPDVASVYQHPGEHMKKFAFAFAAVAAIAFALPIASADAGWMHRHHHFHHWHR